MEVLGSREGHRPTATHAAISEVALTIIVGANAHFRPIIENEHLAKRLLWNVVDNLNRSLLNNFIQSCLRISKTSLLRIRQELINPK